MFRFFGNQIVGLHSLTDEFKHDQDVNEPLYDRREKILDWLRFVHSLNLAASVGPDSGLDRRSGQRSRILE